MHRRDFLKSTAGIAIAAAVPATAFAKTENVLPPRHEHKDIDLGIESNYVFIDRHGKYQCVPFAEINHIEHDDCYGYVRHDITNLDKVEWSEWSPWPILDDSWGRYSRFGLIYIPEVDQIEAMVYVEGDIFWVTEMWGVVTLEHISSGWTRYTKKAPYTCIAYHLEEKKHSHYRPNRIS